MAIDDGRAREDRRRCDGILARFGTSRSRRVDQVAVVPALMTPSLGSSRGRIDRDLTPFMIESP